MTRDEVLVLPTGRRLGYRRYGADSTPRLLYLHGRPGSRAEIGLYDEDLLIERELCAVALDRPGYGLTDPTDELDPLARAADAAQLLEHLDRREVTGQGVSGVGVPALATAVAARPRVVGVVLTSAAGLNDPDGAFEGLPPDVRAQLLRERDDKVGARGDAEELSDALRRDPMATWREMTAHWSEPERALLEAKQDVLVEDSLEAVSHGGLGYFADNMASWQPWPRAFDELDLPVHVFHGEGDQWAPMAALRAALSALPDVRWTTYDGDHLSPFVTRERQAAMLDVAG
jgi:pimeloyl-ACP methyl ester carboxylesterase